MNTYQRGLARATRSTALAAALLSMTIAPVVHAGGQRHNAQSFTDYARVVAVDPIYSKVAYEKPRRECWLEEQHHTTVYEGNAHGQGNQQYGRRTHSAGSTIAGGVIGGVIGNQLGKRGSSSTRIGATVVGAIIGSAIANEKPHH
nr:glycine zipper 2TM domain-containing protein [Gammaproteobacteria bacterium]